MTSSYQVNHRVAPVAQNQKSLFRFRVVSPVLAGKMEAVQSVWAFSQAQAIKIVSMRVNAKLKRVPHAYVELDQLTSAGRTAAA